MIQQECRISELPPGTTKLKSELVGSGFPRANVITFTAPQASARAWLASCPIQVPSNDKPKAAWPANGLLDASPLAVMQGPLEDETVSLLKNWPVEPSVGYKGMYSIFAERTRCEITVRAPDLETVDVEIRQWRESVRL